MKKQLLPLKKNVYKTALHVHTQVSDGELTPEELRDYYKKHGYSVVAYTDHEVLVEHTDLAQDDFLPITSYEISINAKQKVDCYDYTKTYHLNIYLPDPHAKTHFAFTPSTVWGNAVNYINDEIAKINYNREYSIDCVNDVIKRTNEIGGFVSYNHPFWSLQDRTDYIDMKGVWGIEVYNHGGFDVGYYESYYPLDELLRQGVRVLPLAVDDSHNYQQSCGGWAMVMADNLTYDEVFNALKKGDMYSSNGPEIKDIYLEDGYVYVKTSKVKQITLTTDRRFVRTIHASDDNGIDYAKFYIGDYLDKTVEHNVDKDKAYIRIFVTGFDGSTAWSRAYFYDELV